MGAGEALVCFEKGEEGSFSSSLSLLTEFDLPLILGFLSLLLCANRLRASMAAVFNFSSLASLSSGSSNIQFFLKTSRKSSAFGLNMLDSGSRVKLLMSRQLV